jgi:16S rRNA (guanine966-N2)-methyltransferase
MRIVAGKLSHRIIDMTNLDTTSETQDKVRGAIYNMIGSYFDGGNALDLFAGSGAMGIEEYSRGIEKFTLNDLNKNAIVLCKRNCKSLGITNDVTFTNMDYNLFCETINQKYSSIILDPPYKMDDIKGIFDKVYPLPTEDGIIVFEMGIDSIYPKEFHDMELWNNKESGIKRVVVYRR